MSVIKAPATSQHSATENDCVYKLLFALLSPLCQDMLHIFTQDKLSAVKMASSWQSFWTIAMYAKLWTIAMYAKLCNFVDSNYEQYMLDHLLPYNHTIS